MPNGWSWTEDRQWASSRTIKGGDDSHYAWTLEVRSENFGAGSQRLGEIIIHVWKIADESRIAIREEPV